MQQPVGEPDIFRFYGKSGISRLVQKNFIFDNHPLGSTVEYPCNCPKAAIRLLTPFYVPEIQFSEKRDASMNNCKSGSVPGSEEKQGVGAFCTMVSSAQVIIVWQQARGDKPVAYFRMIFVGEFWNITDRLGFCQLKIRRSNIMGRDIFSLFYNGWYCLNFISNPF